VSTARDLLAVALLVIAVILGGLWLPATWAQHNVVDQEGFLAITQPLADDPETQRTIGDSAVAAILDDDRIPDRFQEQVTPLAEEQAARLTGTEAYGTMWESAMVELHRGLFTAGAHDLDVDLGPAIDQILGAVEEQLPVTIPRPDGPSITLATIPDLPLLTHATVLDPWAQRAGPAALAAVAAAVLLAAHRRTMVTLAGVAGILAGAVTCLIASQVELLVPDSADQADFIGPIVQALQQQLSADVVPQGIILLGAGALVTAAGLVLMGLHRPYAPPRR